jgi:hypothetical protein
LNIALGDARKREEQQKHRVYRLRAGEGHISKPKAK